ncbi:hypothetical protein [Haladaptatus halobius]|uniref:hypothetical protein n=1 Tax=Haladaptatus halobius TaxID=2884875 RepID=UPI001D0B764A|nr:hypothetical protein [Haladaptatus halobius]
MDSSPSSLSRRGFLTTSGTLGASDRDGRAETTTESPAEDAPEPEWTVSGSRVLARTGALAAGPTNEPTCTASVRLRTSS